MSFVARVSRPSCEKKPSLRIAGNVAIPFCPRAGAREGRGESSGGGRGAGKRGGARVIYFFHDLDTPLPTLAYAKAVRAIFRHFARRERKAVREFAEAH